MEIVVNWAVVTVGSVVLAFVFNQALKWAGVSLSEGVRKGIVFGAAVALTAYSAYAGGFDLPNPATDPFAYASALLALAAAVFKVSQQVYDKLWQGLLKA